ncbi:MAG: Na+/H+ antiporter NhaC family protein [Acidobacteriota bacterium]
MKVNLTGGATKRGEEGALHFRAGRVGLLAPFLVMFGGIVWLGLEGAALPEAFWPVVLLGLFVGLLAARNRKSYVEALIAGASSPMLAIMLFAWFLAGIFGALLSAAGMVEGLVWLASQAHLSMAWFPLLAFLVSTVLSLSTGTSIGSLLVVTPVLFPVGFSLGADPLMMIGAFVGGAYVGDNLAPISDTTIVSAYTQGTQVSRVVRSRIRYALAAGAMTLLSYALIALFSPAQPAVVSTAERGDPGGLIMLLVPLFLVLLMVRGSHLIAALFYTLFFGLALGLLAQRLRPSDLFNIDSAHLSAGGVVIEGINSMLGIAVFSILLMGLVGVLEKGGFIEWLVRRAERFATDATRAEVSIVGVTLLVNALTTAGTPSMIILGPFVRRLGHHFRITPWRRANLLDACSTSIIGFLPYSLSVLIPFSLVGGQVAGSQAAAGFSPVHAIPYVFYCWALLLTIVVAALTGWGRDFLSEDAYREELRELGGG